VTAIVRLTTFALLKTKRFRYQLEVSPDGRSLYYQPCSGPLYCIDTRWLDDGSIGDAERAKHVERFADTPPTGGTAIDAAGNIYLSDTDRERVIKITPEEKVSPHSPSSYT